MEFETRLVEFPFLALISASLVQSFALFFIATELMLRLQ